MNMKLIATLIVPLLIKSECNAFSINPTESTSSSLTTSSSTTSSNSSRRTFFEQLSKSSFIAFGGNLLLMNDNAIAASTSSTSTSTADATIWKSGKQPIVPGKKQKDKNDVNGTRKDPDFLRSIATCKNQCENSYGPDGYARAKEECLSDCQDICCKTYEQCTFAIIPRI